MPDISRRRLLELSAVTTTALALAPGRLLAADPAFTWRNWANNLYAEPNSVAAPETEQAIVELMARGSGEIRPIGSGHSWSPLVPTEGDMITLDGLMGVISHDPDTLQAEVWAGTKLFLLGPMLESVGQAVLNMSDINYQSLAGAIATSTHGTGKDLGCMSAFVEGLRLVTPSGEVIDCNRENNGDLLRAAVTSMGALGVITRIRLQNQAAHRLHQREWLTPTDEVYDQIEQLAADNQQFELFPIPNCNRTIVVVTNEAEPGAPDQIVDEPYGVLTLRDAFNATRWIPGLDDFVYNTALDLAYGEPKDRIGPSYQVLAHPRVVPFAEMEYTVPAEQGIECLREVMAAIAEKAPDVAFPLEYRYIKGDDSLIGMFSGQDGCAISVHQFMDEPNWEDYLAAIEPVFHKYRGRPHWGKWHSMGPKQLKGLYPNWGEFMRIRKELDPTGRMLNPYMRELFGLS